MAIAVSRGVSLTFGGWVGGSVLSRGVAPPPPVFGGRRMVEERFQWSDASQELTGIQDIKAAKEQQD